MTLHTWLQALVLAVLISAFVATALDAAADDWEDPP